MGTANQPLTFGSLFAGIGGMDLGLERAGMQCKWQIEINPFCRRVLEKHWPHVKRYGDITAIDGSELESVDLIAGGFPCKDVSDTGRRAGIDGPQSGLWREMRRIIGVLRPRFVLVENVAGLLNRGVGRVLGELSMLGFDTEWSVIPACSVGAPHTRERVFIVGYASRSGRPRLNWRWSGSQLANRHQTAWREGSAESAVRRVAYGVPGRVDRITALGNAVVPQVAELIGRCIQQTEVAL